MCVCSVSQVYTKAKLCPPAPALHAPFAPSLFPPYATVRGLPAASTSRAGPGWKLQGAQWELEYRAYVIKYLDAYTFTPSSAPQLVMVLSEWIISAHDGYFYISDSISFLLLPILSFPCGPPTLLSLRLFGALLPDSQTLSVCKTVGRFTLLFVRSFSTSPKTGSRASARSQIPPHSALAGCRGNSRTSLISQGPRSTGSQTTRSSDRFMSSLRSCTGKSTTFLSLCGTLFSCPRNLFTWASRLAARTRTLAMRTPRPLVPSTCRLSKSSFPCYLKAQERHDRKLDE